MKTTIRFPVRIARTLPTLAIFAASGVLAAAAALIQVAVTDAEAKQPWALVFLVLVVPGIWVVFLLCLAAFSIRITDDRIEKVFLNRWVVASKSLSDLRTASVVNNTLQLAFADGASMRLAAMPLRDRALLASVLTERCPRVPLS